MNFESADYLIRFAVYTGAFTTLVTLLVVLLMLVVRFSRAHDAWMTTNVTTRWLDALGGASSSAFVADLPSLRRRTAFHLLRQWSVAYARDQSQSGDPNSASRLQMKVEVAHQVRLDHFALELIETGSNEEIMAAAIVLGQLRIEKAWIPLKRRASAHNPFVSAVAVEALVRIDAERAIPVIIEALATNGEWPDHVLGRMLGNFSELQVHTIAAGVLARGSFDPALHLFRALERRGNSTAGVVLEWLTDHLRSPDDVKACCYAALQEVHLKTVIRLYNDGVDRAEALVENERSNLAGEPTWIQRRVLATRPRTTAPSTPPHDVRSRG